MGKNTKKIFLIGLLFVLAAVSSAKAAQEGGKLQLRLTRNFGYGGFGKIEGYFTLKIVDPPADLVEATFYIDNELLKNVGDPPFQAKFHTAEFPPGEHQLSARGKLTDGNQLESNTLREVFLSSEEAWSDTQKILVPLLIGMAVLTMFGVAVPLLISRKKEFVVGSYGPAGGVVCPRCGLPFSRSVLAPNLLVGKLVRCSHCGKVSVLARASRSELEAAEMRYISGENSPGSRLEKSELRKILDESRFED